MRPVCGCQRGSRLSLLFIVFRVVVARSQEEDSQEAPTQCDRASAPLPIDDAGLGSLLQVKSRMDSEQPVIESHAPPALKVASGSKGAPGVGLIQALKQAALSEEDHSQLTGSAAAVPVQALPQAVTPVSRKLPVEQTEIRHRGPVESSLLAMLAHVDGGYENHVEIHRHPTFWIVIVLMVLAVCCLCSMFKSVNEDIRNEGKRKQDNESPGTARSLPFAPSPGQSQTPYASRMASQSQLPSSPAAMPVRQPTLSPSLPNLPMPTQTTRHLCPGLVVPHGNECILAVPALPDTGGQPGQEVASLNVQDLDGKSVIQAEVVLPNSTRASVAMTQRPLVVLRAGSVPRAAGQQAQPLLAYCKASHEVGARKSVYIYDARDELFAQVVKDSGIGRYILTSGRISLRLSFEGDILKHVVNVTNEHRQTVAETAPATMPFNPTGNFYKLRVVSNVDVGLILCALFAIGCMESF